MPIDNAIRERRRSYIGASDSPAILGVCPFRTPADVWRQKAGIDNRDHDDDEAHHRIELGNVLETALLEYAEHLWGVTLERQVFLVSEQNPLFSATLDGRCDQFIVECKTTRLAALWGPPNSRHIPQHVNIQVQHQLYVSDARECRIVVLFIGPDLEIATYPVTRDEALIQEIINRGTHFWYRYVKTGTPPPEQPVRTGWAFPDESILERYQNVQQQRKALDAEYAELQQAIRTYLGDSDVVETPCGYRIRRVVYQRHSLDQEKLRMCYPDIYRACLAPRPVVQIRVYGTHSMEADDES